LITGIVLLFAVLYSIQIGISIYQSKQLVEQQMKVHAQDTATSLALSMSQVAMDKDDATLETFLNAVSDSGYYQKIDFADLDGNTILQRSFPVHVEGVPNWFVTLVKMPLQQGVAEVSSGWTRLGVLTVVSHPGQFYQRLWQQNKRQLWLFSLVTLGVCLLSAIALGVLLRPLARVERQANAICNKDFMVQSNLPRSRELRSVVLAMNRMATQLKDIFDGQLNLIQQFQHKSLVDPVTGLSNRADFDARLDSLNLSTSAPESGALYIVALSQLERINRMAGREEGNTILRRMGAVLVKVGEGYPGVLLGRRQGAEFSLFVPGLDKTEALHFARIVFESVRDIEWKLQSKESLIIHMGMSFTTEIINVRDLLVEADLALQKAQSTSESSGWAELGGTDEGNNIPLLSSSVVDWRALIESELATNTLPLVLQSIYSPEKQVIGQEVLARLASAGQLISADIFMPLVERFGCSVEFDQLVLNRVTDLAQTVPDDQFICVNLCAGSVQSDEFLSWLDDWLLSEPTLASRLIIEIPEHAMRASDAIQALIDILQRHNVGLGIDHFGLDSSAFGYLGCLPLNHAKIHHNFIQGIDTKADNRFYIESLAQITRSRDILLMVEGVESQQEWDAVMALGVDAAQGFWLSAEENEFL
jgi:diguanylate cyclase (GGDEF)-like protein